jgi:hypothetical protein
MFDPFELRGEFFEGLVAIDEAIVERAAAEPCQLGPHVVTYRTIRSACCHVPNGS